MPVGHYTCYKQKTTEQCQKPNAKNRAFTTVGHWDGKSTNCVLKSQKPARI